MSHHFGCQRNRFIVKLHMYVLPQLPNYYIIKLCWCRSNAWCTPLCDTLLDFGCYGNHFGRKLCVTMQCVDTASRDLVVTGRDIHIFDSKR